MTSTAIHPSSYRDPSGFIFEKEGTLYRQVNRSFSEHFDHFIQSGCYKHLVERGLLIPHEQIDHNVSGHPDFYTTLKPERIDYISYPYEWSFDMLKDAALLTLQLIREALHYGMILKDATPYNVQWHRNRLIFIDTLSFEKYQETPWIAYRQFCESFLGPLLLSHYSHKPLHTLFLAWPDGIPLDIIQSLLPRRTKFSLHIYLHIHLHHKVSNRKPTATPATLPAFSRAKLLRLITSLETVITSLRLPAEASTWSGYYEEASLRNDYLQQKTGIIASWLDELPFIRSAADLGANRGEFSHLLANRGIQTVAADFDPYCINTLYQVIKGSGQQYIQPMIIDLARPSPAIGVNNEERSSFVSRTNKDMIFALALIHHLAIGKNIPLEKIAAFFVRMGNYLVIEYVPKEDEKIRQMLAQKKDIYTEYTEEKFEVAFGGHFSVEKKIAIPGSSRTLYLMKRH
jgi:hypothetical protein